MTVYDSYTILNPTPGKYEADHPLVIGVNQSRVKTTINVPEIFAAGRYYFRGVNTVISGVVASDAGKPAYIEANLQDGEIGAGTLMLLSVQGVEANFPYSIKHVPLFETEIDASEIDTSGLVTKDTFNSTVARIDADIQKGDTDLRLDLDALTSRFTQLSSEVNAELDTFDESLGQLDTDMKNLAAEVDGYDTRITNAENAASSANTVAQAASSAASAAQTTADEAKTSIAPLDAKITQLAADVKTAEVTANQAKSTADAAAQTAGNAQSAASAAQSAAGAAQISADVAKTAADNAQSAADEAKQVAQTNAGDIAGIIEQVNTIQQKDSEQDVKIGALESTTASTTETVNTLQENFNNLNDSVGNLGTAMQTAQQDIAGLEMRFDDLQTFYVKSRQTRSGNVKPGGDPYSIPASVLSLLINIVGPSYSQGETITFEFYANTTDESPVMQIPCRVLSTDITNLDVLVDFAAGTFSIYETDISQTPAKQLTKKLANGFNVMRTYPDGYKKINVKTSATHETPNTMFMVVRSLF